jgi:hypothetical protein
MEAAENPETLMHFYKTTQIISQETATFRVTAVRTSCLTKLAILYTPQAVSRVLTLRIFNYGSSHIFRLCYKMKIM